jgi:hypothetical protein
VVVLVLEILAVLWVLARIDPEVAVVLARQVKMALSIQLVLVMAVQVMNGLWVLVITTVAAVAADCILPQLPLAQEA